MSKFFLGCRRKTYDIGIRYGGRSKKTLFVHSILIRYRRKTVDIDYDFQIRLSLAHDIGNPPFGHSGEKAIGEYFSIGKGQQYKDQLTAKQWQDLIDFEGKITFS